MITLLNETDFGFGNMPLEPKACVIRIDKRVTPAHDGEERHYERLQCCIAKLRNLDCAWFDSPADTLHERGDRLKIDR